VRGKQKKKKLSRRKVSYRKTIRKVKKNKPLLRSSRITLFTFIIGLLIGLSSVLLIWPHFLTKPVLAFSSSDGNITTVTNNQCLIIQSTFYEEMKQGLEAGAKTNLYVSIIPSRRLVVDQDQNIKEIYSNTGETEQDFKLFASYNNSGNEEVTLTAKILDQYNELMENIDWSKIGLVYPAP